MINNKKYQVKVIRIFNSKLKKIIVINLWEIIRQKNNYKEKKRKKIMINYLISKKNKCIKIKKKIKIDPLKKPNNNNKILVDSGNSVSKAWKWTLKKKDEPKT